MKKIVMVALLIGAAGLLYIFTGPWFLPSHDAGAAGAKATAVIEPAKLPLYVSAKVSVRINLPGGLLRGETVSTQLANTFMVNDLSYSMTKDFEP